MENTKLSRYFMNRRRQVPKSKVAAIVHQQAKPYCQISFICKESLACTRYEAASLQHEANYIHLLFHLKKRVIVIVIHHHFLGKPTWIL
jgi:hypothetical protein